MFCVKAGIQAMHFVLWIVAALKLVKHVKPVDAVLHHLDVLRAKLSRA